MGKRKTQPLTKLERYWLNIAALCGYEHGFIALPRKGIKALEARGLIERNPDTCMRRGLHHFRITEAGEALDLQLEKVSK